MTSPVIIIPAYNVGTTIGPLLDNLKGRSIVVVDDGSVDNTGEIVRSKDVPLITHGCNRGVGAALKSGIEYGLKCGFKKAISIDADGQHSPDRIEDFEAQLAVSSFVIGNRCHNLTALPTQKLCSNLLGSVVVEELFEIKVPDVACGFRGFQLEEELLGIEADSYDYIFEEFFYLLQRFQTVDLVDIPAEYSMDILLCTRIAELSGFLQTVLHQCHKHPRRHQLAAEVATSLACIEQRVDFKFELGKYLFNAFYIERSSAYVIQTDQCNIWDFHHYISETG